MWKQCPFEIAKGNDNVGGQTPCQFGQTELPTKVVEPRPKSNELVHVGAAGEECQLVGRQLQTSTPMDESTGECYQDLMNCEPFDNTEPIDVSNYIELESCDETFFDDICVKEESQEGPRPTKILPLDADRDGVELQVSSTGGSVIADDECQPNTSGLEGSGIEDRCEELRGILSEYSPQVVLKAKIEQEKMGQQLESTFHKSQGPQPVVVEGGARGQCQVASTSYQNCVMTDAELLEISSMKEFPEFLEQTLVQEVADSYAARGPSCHIRISRSGSTAVETAGSAHVEKENVVTTGNVEEGDHQEPVPPPQEEGPIRPIFENTTEVGETALEIAGKSNGIDDGNKTSGTITNEESRCDDTAAVDEVNVGRLEILWEIDLGLVPVTQYEFCLLCPKMSRLPEGGQVDHLIQHHSDSSNKCPLCPKHFKGQNLLRIHLQCFHKLGTEHNCPICKKPSYGKPTPSKHLWTHYSRKEMEDAVARGEKIPAQIKKKLNILKILYDNNNPPHPVPAKKEVAKKWCKICKKWLKNLKGHTRQCHTEMKERRYVCMRCKGKKRFVTNSGLRKHMLTSHREGKMLKCEHCTKEFWSSVLLKAHLDQVHYKTPPWECPHCDKTYRSKSSLARHIKQIHEK